MEGLERALASEPSRSSCVGPVRRLLALTTDGQREEVTNGGDQGGRGELR